MTKNVLIISTSMRKNSNSDELANAFLEGVKVGDNTVEKISLSDKKIGFCKGCLACQKTKKCIINDDANSITEKMCKADVIVFATPVYYYEMSGQMKTLLDRANSLFSSDYAFRDIYLLSAAADTDDETDVRAVNGLEGWIKCFPKAKLAGTVFAGGVNGTGEVEDHPALKKAYELGKAI